MKSWLPTTESELLSSVVSLAPAFNKKNHHCAVATELQSGNRIIDIVIAVFRAGTDYLTSSPISSRFKSLTLHHLMILERIIALERTSTWALTSELHIEEDVLKNRYLTVLEKYGLVNKAPSFNYEVNTWTKVRPITIISIEMKIHRWREALGQARTNLRVSDESYIAIPKNLFRRHRREMTMIRRDGIGLMTVDDSALARIEIAARNTSSTYSPSKELQKLKILRSIAAEKQKWHMID